MRLFELRGLVHDFFGALLVLIIVHAVLANGEIIRYPLLMMWHGTWVVLALAAYAYIRVFYREFGPLYDSIVESAEDAGDSITEILLKLKGRPLIPAPGQFIYVSFDADVVNKEPHPFSISSPPHAPHLRLSIKRLGDWPHDVEQIKSGKSARAWGPYGQFTKLEMHEIYMRVAIGRSRSKTVPASHQAHELIVTRAPVD